MQQNQRRAVAIRSACDRCRDHKLRCLRSQGPGDGDCSRCVRAGATCVTGAPRPLGRSRAGPDDPHKQRQDVRRPRHSVFVSVTVPNNLATTVTPSAPVPASEADGIASATGRAQPQELVASRPTRDSEGSFGRFYEAFPADSGESSSALLDERASSSDKTPDFSVADALPDTCIGFPDDATLLSDLIGGSAPNSGAFPLELEADLDEFCRGFQPASEPLSALSGPDNPSLCVDPALLLPALPSSTLDITTKLLPGPSFGTSGNALVRLSRINERIAHQLSHLDTFIMGIPPPNLINSCVDNASNLQVNPILGALESTSELAAIIREIISPVQEHGPSPPVSTPVVLMCLSGHIQLLQIYNSVFSHVHRFLGSLHDVPCFFENLPGFTHISGLPPIQGDLYIKIIIQVAQHNIRSVERRLGLPADLCLSAQRLLPNGLLSYVDSLEPFQSIMDQACSPSEKSGRALVASLRTKIGEVLGILRDNY